MAAGLDNAALTKILQPDVRVARGVVDPDWEAAFIRHTQSKITLTKLWEEYVGQVGESQALKYSAFCENFNRFTHRLPDDLIDGYLALEWNPGEYVQIDYSGDGVPITDIEGKTKMAQIFVAVLPYSGYIFAYATADQKRDSWLDALVMLFHHLGGTPSYLILDNAKALVIKASKFNPVLNPEFKTFCRYYGVVPDAVNPYRPRQKGAVENSVKIVQNQILKPIEGHRFFDLASLNAKLAEMLAELNAKPVAARGGLSRKELAAREQLQFKDLPAIEYELSIEIKLLTVRKDGCIRLGNSRYGVPYRFIGKKVEVRVMPRARKVLIFFEGRQITEHAYRKTDEAVMTRKLEHLKPEHRFALLPPEELMQEIGQCGPQSEQFCEHLYEHLAKPLLKRQLQGCLSLIRQVGPNVFEECCGATLESAKVNLEALQERIRFTASQQEPKKPATKPNTHSMPHSSVKSSFRGATYYRNTKEADHEN